MSHPIERRRSIFEKTNGKCHICHRKHRLSAYGQEWHVDHSVALAVGGSDHLNNLFVACVSCNCAKQDGATRTARAAYGKIRAPLSAKKLKEARTSNTIVGSGLGAVGLGLLFGPPGFWAGMLLGGLIGNDMSVK